MHIGIGTEKGAMKQNKVTLVSLASALAAIAPAAQGSIPTGPAAPVTAPKADHGASSPRQPNTFYNLGEDLMGLVTSTAEDGTVIAEHYSHSSHASHQSHASHYSGR
jgi:hypothetical protein